MNWDILNMFCSVTKLHECKNVEQLYYFLGCEETEISKFLYSGVIKYRSFSILKKNGNFRNIRAPVKYLKEIQYKIKDELEKYYTPKSCAHGFIAGRNIITNARPHVRKEFILNIDLKDFFDSINFGRVSRLFQSQPLNLPENVAHVLAHICCYNRALPQGAPTSPIISNMISYRLDRQLKELARNNACTYSRYADDITFSFTKTKKYLPKSIVSLSKDNNIILGREFKKVIEDNWFEINEEKVRLQHKTQRQSVTNITVNTKININRKFKKQTSAMVNALFKYGASEAEREYFSKYHKGYIAERQYNKIKEKPGLLFTQKVRGRLNYIRLVCGKNNESWRKLMYKYTVAIEQPNEEYNRTLWDIAGDSTFILWSNSSQGSGFFLENIGLVTNEHVIEGIESSNINNDLIILWLPNERKEYIELHLAWKDNNTDLAVITSNISFLDIKPLQVEPIPIYDIGTEVYAVGYPNYDARGTIGKPTIITAKITSIITREKQERIVIDQPIVHGHSGGVVLNADGRVIGIVANGNAEGELRVVPNAFIPIKTLLNEHKLRTKS